MESHTNLSNLLKGQLEYIPEKHFDDLKKEVADINKKMKVLPTSREMDAKEDLLFLQTHTCTIPPKTFETLQKSTPLQNLIITDLFNSVATAFIKTRIYNNKSLIKTTDTLFKNLTIFISKNIKKATAPYFQLLNTIINPSGDFFKNNGQELVHKYPFGVLLEITESHKNWVDSLKIGDKVDFLRGAQDYKIWTRAVVLEDDYHFKIKFLGSDGTHYVRNQYYDLMPFKSLSKDFEWREGLAVGDFVDYYRYKSKWNVYKVLEVCEEVVGEEVFRKVRVVRCGFEGGEEFMEVGVHSPLIAKQGVYSGKDNFTFDEDRVFLAKEKEEKFAIMRKFSFVTNSSIYIIRYINEFGKYGGFDFILKVIKNEVTVSKEIFSYIITFLQSVGEFLVEPFIEKNGLLILETIQTFLLSNAEMNLREITPKTLQILIRGIKGLSQRIHSPEKSDEIANTIKTKLAILCLKSNFLEKQFFGAKILTEISSEISKSSNLHKSLVKYKVFDKIIKGHPHLIAKGEGVMKILFEANAIKKSDLLSLWEQILKTDIESRNSLLKLLSQVIPNLSDDFILFLSEKMLESSADINDREIVQVLFEIQKMGGKRENLEGVLRVINETLWGVIQSGRKLKDEFLEEVVEHFVTAVENEGNFGFFEKVLENVLEERMLFRNVLLMKKFVNSLVFDFREEVCRVLKEKKVGEVILGKVYIMLKENLEKGNREVLFSENEIERINQNFGLVIEIKDKLENENLIKFESVEKIWDEIFNQNVKNDLLLNWIKIYFLKSKTANSDTNFVKFFQKNIVRMKEENKEYFFYILVIIFFKIQIFRSNLIKKTVFLETPGLIKDFETSKDIFILNNKSESLKCFEELWNLFLETSNAKLEEEISKFFVKLLFPKNSKTPNKEIYDLEEKKLTKKAKDLLFSKNFQKIKKAIFIIQKILKIKENSGFGILQSFSSMLKLPKITLEIQQNKYYYKNSFKMQTGLNTSLGSIRSKIAQTYEMEFLSVKILRNTKELPHSENSKTLSDLNFSNSEKTKLIIDEYALPKIQNHPILEKSGNFTKKALKVFKEIFAVYSENGKMRKKHLAAMTSAATDRMVCKEDDDRVLNVFRNYDPERTGFISESRFVEFYLESTKKHKIKIVRSNLISFGYNKNLDPKNCFLEKSDFKSSFRFGLCEDDRFFEILKSVFLEEIYVNDRVYFFEFLKKLTPNLNFLKNLSRNPVFEIGVFCDSVYLWYYYCGVLDSLLFNRNELLPFFSLLKLEQNFNFKKFLNILFSKEFAKCFQKSLDNRVDENVDEFIFFTSFGLFDKMLKICLQNLDNNYFDRLLNDDKNDEKKDIEKDKKKKTSLSDDDLYKQSDDIYEKKNEDIKQLKNFSEKTDKSKIEEFFKNLDLLKINKFTKKFLNKYIKEKENLNLQQINYIKIFLSIWINTIIANKEIISDLLNSAEFEEFLICGLTHKNKKLRNLFYENFIILLESSKNFKLKTECLKIFIKNIQNNQNIEIQAIIEISSNLLSQISSLKNNEEIKEEEREILKQFDFLKLFKEFSQMLKTYKSKETFENQDTTLTAILSFMTKILQADCTILESLPCPETNTLLNFLFTNCLFHITKKSINFSTILCKSKNSRNAAQKLLSQITYKNKKNSIKTLKNFSTLSKYLPVQTTALNFSNYNEKKSSLNFLGIKNPGCVCYMIAMLQQFYCTPTFRYGILMADDKKPETLFSKDNFEIDDNVFHQLQKMFSYLDFSERKAFDPKSFCMSYMDITGERVDISVQQDSQEFLNVIFDRLDRALKPTPFKGIMDSVFAGKIASVYTCKNCGNEFSNEQLFYNLSLEVKNMDGIEDSFKKFNSEEIISDYTCDSCKKKVDVSKRAFIKELPNVLIIHLQKIIFDLEYLANIKISSRYEFGKKIDLKNIIFKEKKNEDDEEEDIEIKENDEDEFTYKLVGVVLHRGNAEYGHYTSLINVNRKDPNRANLDKDVWYNFDDSRISKYNMKNFDEDCFGEVKKEKTGLSSHMLNMDIGSSKSAYILVYDKVKKSKIHFQFNEENISEKQKILNSFIDKKNYKFENNTLETDFYNIGKYLPEKLKTQINNDNSSLVLEDQLFNKSFIENFSSLILNSGLPTLSELEKHLKSKKTLIFSDEQKKLAKTLITLLPHYIKKIYYVTSQNDSLPSLDLTLRKSMIILKENCVEFFEELLVNDFVGNMSLLLMKSDCVIRKSMGNRILSCFEIYGLEKKIDLMVEYSMSFFDEYRYQKCMEDFLDKLPSKYASNYRKSISYFLILKKMIIRIESLVNFIIKKGYLKKIIQFYIHQDAKMTAERRVLGIALNIFTLILKKYTLLPEKQKEEIKEEYEEALEIIKSTDFYEKIIKEDYLSQENFQPIFDIITYLCKSDPQTNNKFLNKSLKSLNHCMHDNTITILEITKRILSIKDPNQKKRIKNFLGETQLNEDKTKNKKKDQIIYKLGLNREISQKRAIKSSPSFLNMEKGLISHLYKNKKYNETSCLLIIYFILQMCNSDEIFFEYFIHMQGPTYNEPNNYCWFENYIGKTVAFIMDKNQYSKKELINYCFSKLEKEFSVFKMKIEKKLEEIGQSGNVQLLQNLDSEKIYCFGKKKWVIGETNDVRDLGFFCLNEDLLKFEFKVLNLNLVEEESDGIKILNLPWNLLNEKLYEGDNENSGLREFVGEKYEDYYEGKEFYCDDEEDCEANLDNKTNNLDNQKKIFIQNDFILRISISNMSQESYYVKLKISSQIENPNFEETEIIIGVNRTKNDMLIHYIEKIDIDKGFEGLKIEAAFEEMDFLSFKDFEEDGLSDFEEIFIYK